jgi:uncharacterized protein YdaU (DUF1376 family)
MVAYMGQTRRVGVRTTGRTSPGDVILLGFFCREEKKSTFFFCGKKKIAASQHGMAWPSSSVHNATVLRGRKKTSRNQRLNSRTPPGPC